MSGKKPLPRSEADLAASLGVAAVELDPAQSALLDAMANLIARAGTTPFFSLPLLLPTPEFFPEGVPKTLGELRALVDRLMAYVGLPELDIAVELFDTDEPDAVVDERGATFHQNTAAYFRGIVDDVCHFGVRQQTLDDPELLLGVLAHEVCHAYRAFHQLQAIDREVEERLTDLTSVYLGLGVLTTSSAYDKQSSGRMQGSTVSYRVKERRSGYLPPEEMAFLLAVHVVARPDSPPAKVVASELPDHQSRAFRAAVKQLRPARVDVLERLRGAAELPDGSSAVATALERLTQRRPLPKAPQDGMPLWTPVERSGPETHTYRIHALAAGAAGLYGFGLSLVAGAVTHSPVWLSLVGAAVCALLARYVPWYRCTHPDCGATVGKNAAQCRKCHRTIRGTIQDIHQRLE